MEPSGFSHHLVDTSEVRLHAVVGGEGPPLLLLAGWPQTWYAWRLVMPELARHFTVVAADSRGVGRSDKPAGGYDTARLATDMVELMAALGHDRFAMFGHDVGMWTAYALAADHPERLTRLAVAEAAIPGLSPTPPLFSDYRTNARLWHFAFNRLDGVNEELVRGREDVYFGHQFATKAAKPLEQSAIDLYVETLRDPEALRASFEFYRALDVTMAQNERRKQTRLTLPVLAIGGAASNGDRVETTMRLAADDVRGVVLDGCGHFPAEEAPEETLAAVLPFLTE